MDTWDSSSAVKEMSYYYVYLEANVYNKWNLPHTIPLDSKASWLVLFFTLFSVSAGERCDDNTYALCKATGLGAIYCYCSKSKSNSGSSAEETWYWAVHASEPTGNCSTNLWTVSVCKALFNLIP